MKRLIDKKLKTWEEDPYMRRVLTLIILAQNVQIISQTDARD